MFGRQRRETSLNTSFITGVIAAFVLVSGLFGMFSGMAETEDWVLEYAVWVRVGLLFLFAVIVSGFVIVPWRIKRKRHGETSK